MRFKSKHTLWLIIPILLIAFVLWGIPLAVNTYLNANAERIVSNMITRADDFGGHEVKFGHIRMDYDFSGTYLELRDVEIFPGEAIPEDKIRFFLQADQAYFTGFSWTSFLLENSITADSAVLKNIFIESYSPPLEDLEFAKTKYGTSLGYDLLSVEKIQFNHFSFTNFDSSNDSTRLHLQELNLSARQFALSREYRDDPNAMFQVEQMEGYIGRMIYHYDDYRNAVEAKSLSFNSQEGHLLVGSLELDNKLEKYEYINQHPYQTNWIELEQGEINLQGVDFDQFLAKGIFEAEQALAKEMRLEVFSDKRKPKDPTRERVMLDGMVLGIPRPIFIHQTKIVNGRISYEERPDSDAPKAGSFFLDDIQVSIDNLTNIQERLDQEPLLKINGRAQIMGQGQLNLKGEFDLLDENGKFHLNGSIGAMPLEVMNDILGPETRMGIKEGQLNNLFFNIHANRHDGTGQVIMKYSDLKIEILDKNYENNPNIFRKAGAFLANTFVVRNNNPDRSGELVKGEVYYKRPVTTPVFAYWWELLRSGILSTFTGATEAEMRVDANEQ